MSDRDRRMRAAEAALRPVGGVKGTQVVGAIPKKVLEAGGIPTACTSVWLNVEKIEHLLIRRGDDDFVFVLEHLPAVVLRPTLAAVDPDDRRRVVLLADVPGSVRHIFACVKYVAAAEAGSGCDELWVATAYPVGRKSLTRLVKRFSFTAVSEL